MAKPSYIEQLKGIAAGEAFAECFLSKWADVSKDKDVENALRFVAMREGEHGYAFRKRVLELTGEAVGQRSDAKIMEMAESTTLSDRQKFEQMLGGVLTAGPGENNKPDQFSKMFDNKDLDPVTGGLLGRYIAEERDSARVLSAAYKKLVAKDPQPQPAVAAAAASGAAALVAELERLAKLKSDGALTDDEFKAAKASMLQSRM